MYGPVIWFETLVARMMAFKFSAMCLCKYKITNTSVSFKSSEVHYVALRKK